jgi:hypothetical protein
VSFARIEFQNTTEDGDSLDLDLPDDMPLSRHLRHHVPCSPRKVVAPGLVASVFYLWILQDDRRHLALAPIPPSSNPEQCAAAMATVITAISEKLKHPEQDLRAEPGGQGNILCHDKRTGGGRPGGTHGRR